ncbi:tetratricopeptide repeat protein [Streptomyces sp. NPDC048002]|uniref:tetratricopeptide repeat protein n=1 Tax=Streptomyces sp. NPDC048002 TaxID=3154344 RepID=UPI00340E29DB
MGGQGGRGRQDGIAHPAAVEDPVVPAAPAPVVAGADGTAPIEVRVPAGGPGRASVDGVPVVAAAGQEIQQAVLRHLHRVALAAGRPVFATIRDDRTGYAVPLRVNLDGSSELTGDPEDTTLPVAPGVRPSGVPAAGVAPQGPVGPAFSGTSSPGAAAPEPTAPARRDSPTHLRRPLPGSEPAFPSSADHRVPASLSSADRRAPASPLSADRVPASPLSADHRVPASLSSADHLAPASPPSADHPAPASPPSSGPGAAPGTVAPPTGVFGPPPVMNVHPATPPGAHSHVGAYTRPVTQVRPHLDEPPPPPKPIPTASPAARPSTPTPPPAPATTSGSRRTPTPARTQTPPMGPAYASGSDVSPKAPTPPRGFDAVAEAVLGDETPPRGTALLAEPVARINEAVRQGRTQDAAELAERTVTESTGTLGPDHPEVLRLRELSAYIAYLSGEPARAFALSLDLARTHHRSRDAESAYGNVMSAATAWRGVRDPESGLRFGRDLIALWEELVAEGGPAAEDSEQLESAHARMDRLTARAADAARSPG